MLKVLVVRVIANFLKLVLIARVLNLDSQTGIKFAFRCVGPIDTLKELTLLHLAYCGSLVATWHEQRCDQRFGLFAHCRLSWKLKDALGYPLVLILGVVVRWEGRRAGKKFENKQPE